jgi:stage V sporulation protein AE
VDYLRAFILGGAICAAAASDRQVEIYARAHTGLFVVSGVVLTAVGVYPALVEWGGAGATVPISGFGYSLAKGVRKAVEEKGFLGALSGGLTATSAGVAAAVLFGYLAALVFKPGDKS